jgi:hypothetical protein
MRPARYQVEEFNIETPKEVYNYRVYILTAIASFGAVIFGYDLAFIGTTLALDSFQKYFAPSTPYHVATPLEPHR